MMMERQGSASSSISLNSWGSDLAEEREAEYPHHQLHQHQHHGFHFASGGHPHDPSLLLQPITTNVATTITGSHPHVPSLLCQTEVLCKDRPSFALPSSATDSFDILLSKRLSLSQSDKEWSSLILMMKERFAKLLLGEDFSGGSRGSNTALTISNAITKLSVAVFGDLWRLEPLSHESKLKWQREMEWLVSPCDYIVELVPTVQTLQGGSTVEVLASRPRSDVYIGLPALQKLDVMLLEILASFSDTEFWYAESVQENTPTTELGCKVQDCKVWVPVAKVPSHGLSDQARKELSQQRESANQILKAAKSINEHVLSEMEVPGSYLKSLPKSGKKVIGDTPLKIITSEYCCFETLLSTVDCPSYKSLSDLANSLESLIHVWKAKINHRLKQAFHPDDMACRGTPSWGISKDSSLKKVEKKRKYVQRAQNLLMELRQRFPGLLQTSLELSILQHNKDVGYAVLESYSRVLVNLAARIQARIGEVIAADKDAMLCRLHSLNVNPDLGNNVAAAEGPLTSPGTSCREPQALKRYSCDGLSHQLERAVGQS